jgi:hypothetical protein
MVSALIVGVITVALASTENATTVAFNGTVTDGASTWAKAVTVEGVTVVLLVAVVVIAGIAATAVTGVIAISMDTDAVNDGTLAIAATAVG